jgi:hypothetical protein
MRLFRHLIIIVVIISLLLFTTLAFGLEDDSSAVQTTTESITLYRWLNAESFPKLHLSAAKLNPSDPKGLAAISAVRLSQGVTASTSPATLRRQGGSGVSWVLFELRVAPGFKTLETTPALLSSAGCPALTPQSFPLPPDCLKSLEGLVSTLSLDGLKLKTGEIVLTNGKYFHSGDIKVFNHLSTENVQDRLIIQSLFYQADFDHYKLGRGDSLFPSEISRLNPPFSGGGRGLLWDDLDGKPLDLAH